MKKLLIIFMSLIITVMFISCGTQDVGGGGTQGTGGNDIGDSQNGNSENNGSEADGDEDSEPEGEYIWTTGSKIYIVGTQTELSEAEFYDRYQTLVSNIMIMVDNYTDAEVKLSNDRFEEEKHEIVIGRSDRQISKEAYCLLDEMAKNDPDNDTLVRYLIYSDGNSVAVAYTNHAENIAVDAVEEYFCEKLAKRTTLQLASGVIKKESYSMNAVHQKRDDDMVAAQWVSLENSIVTKMTASLGETEAKEYAEEIIAALKDIYSMYSDDLVEWFANLYEPYICICDGECQKTRYCGGAGFYYSNAARDNKYTVRDGKEYLLLPDAETTAQVIGFIRNSGMLNMVNGDRFMAFPEGEPERIVRFIKALQDEDTGYFYHPQWLNMPGSWDSRQSRDLNYSESVLRAFGASPTYNTPSGVIGDGILYDGTDLNVATTAGLTLPLTLSKTQAVSRVTATGSVHPNLASEEAFKSYLAKYDSSISYNSYYIGNELASLAEQIVARDKAVGTSENPHPYATILDQWLRKHQNAEGHWHDKKEGEKVYNATNGLLKISALYNTLELPFPNPLPAARCGFEIITSPEPISHVCDLYNTWFIISNITQNLKKYSGNEELAQQIIDEVRVDAIEAVKVTKEKMITHQKDDGSFSYFKDHSSFTSQNMPVTIDGTDEGDVNATVIFTYGILGYMFDSLDFGSKIQMFTDRDREVFIELIEERIKNSEKRQNEN